MNDWDLVEHCSKRVLRECKLLLLKGSSPFICICLFMISLLFHISLSCFLVHSSVAVGRREDTLLFCIAGIDAIWSQMAAKMSNWECLHIINCSCCSRSQRWWEGSQQQPRAEGQRGRYLDSMWLQSAGTGYSQPHSGLRLSLNSGIIGMDLSSPAHKGDGQELALMH